MSNFSMSNTNGCFVAMVGAIARHLNVGSFITQFDLGQPARLGEGRPVYWYKGWANTGAKISGNVFECEIADNLKTKIISAKLIFSWRNDWRETGIEQSVLVKCKYKFSTGVGKFNNGGYKVTTL